MALTLGPRSRLQQDRGHPPVWRAAPPAWSSRGASCLPLEPGDCAGLEHPRGPGRPVPSVFTSLGHPLLTPPGGPVLTWGLGNICRLSGGDDQGGRSPLCPHPSPGPPGCAERTVALPSSRRSAGDGARQLRNGHCPLGLLDCCCSPPVLVPSVPAASPSPSPQVAGHGPETGPKLPLSLPAPCGASEALSARRPCQVGGI